MKVGNMNITIPAYIGQYFTAACSAAIKFNKPTGNVLLSPGINVSAKMYSFQNNKKLNKTTITILGAAIGSITENIVLKYPAPSMLAASSKDRKSTRLNSSHVAISYAVFCL